MKQAPSKFFLRFFRWYCHPKLVNHIEGDLLEVYGKRVAKSGKRSADFRFAVDVLLLCRPGIIRPAEGSHKLNSYGMYKNYLKVGWRNLLRNRSYSIINIGGLAIGMTIAIVNGLWIWDELSFNRYFTNYDTIAQVSEVGLDDGDPFKSTTMTYPLCTSLIEKYGESFTGITRTSFQLERILTAGETKLLARGLYVDASAPEIFSLQMIYGSQKGLARPHSVMIARSTAEALFGSGDAVGQPIRINNKTDVTVAGVFEDLPRNTEFADVKFLAGWDLYLLANKWIEERALNDWRNHFLKIYVSIPEGRSFEAVTAQIRSALQFAPEDLEMALKNKNELQLYPMSDWRLHPTYIRPGQMDPILMLKLVGAIGAFVLILACINFVNLSTARAEKRAKEVGVRKTTGSARSQLATQFYSESLLVVSFAYLLAIVLVTLVLPAFNYVASKEMVLPWGNIWFWLVGIGFVMMTSVLAGFYPALYLSSFNPVNALKGTFRVGRLASIPRRVLVVFQFSISAILIIGTVVVYQQIQHAKNRDVGYDREGLLMINKRSDDFKGKYEMLRHELKNTGAVNEVSESMGAVTEVYSGNGGWDWKGRDPNVDKGFATLSVSHTHGRVAGWQLVQGRDFDIDNPNDSSGIVITESALAFMGLQDPIGEPVSWTFWSTKKVLNYKIIGVIRDMVMDSPYDPTTRTIFFLKGHNGSPTWINIKLNPNVNTSEALSRIESVFKRIVPSVPFDYKFADVEYARKFEREERIGNLALIFAILAIFISCLGLLGLISFVAETRTKEIGIRKVLGASVAGLWRMLSKDFVWLVLVACLVAAPLAYYLMNLWLDRFVYRIQLSAWVLVATTGAAVLITLATVSFQALRAATMNPVNSLRNE